MPESPEEPEAEAAGESSDRPQPDVNAMAASSATAALDAVMCGPPWGDITPGTLRIRFPGAYGLEWKPGKILE
ncbi:hypothetical protein Mth01_31950 [Sphaerimonospora thailandensis]|uniref:Uncharacterized protein n=1 Tax=Sphaerimonospora thailandensis TaxID=795644 RepID=A0A8J3R8B1_9ACTN|nr:hypothetical protein Mth01_31950 [Sphaerimonospora thailandensis]